MRIDSACIPGKLFISVLYLFEILDPPLTGLAVLPLKVRYFTKGVYM